MKHSRKQKEGEKNKGRKKIFLHFKFFSFFPVIIRVYKLRQGKEKLISNIVQLRDERDIVEEESEKLQERIEFVLKRNKILRMRAERLACQVASRSLVFSEAEESMKEELGKLQKRMTEMNKRLETVCGAIQARICSPQIISFGAQPICHSFSLCIHLLIPFFIL